MAPLITGDTIHASLRLHNETHIQILEEYENEMLQSNTFTKNIGGQLGIYEHCVFQTTTCTLFSEPQHSSLNGLVQRTLIKLSQKQKK